MGTKRTISLYDHNGKAYDYDAPNGKAKFNTTNDSVDWARFTWNPVTGCLHGCFYCYAREIANQTKMAASYPAGFDPLFHPERLDAPKNTPLPAKAADDPAFGRVFVGSMADLFGAWVPEEWIERVFEACNAAPRWEYLFLTKFPKRYKRIDLPPAMWAGASVDSQKRVAGTEAAMRDLDVKVRWLSIEPLLEPLKFQDLSWCDLMVIGAQTDTRQPEGYIPSFAPPYRWVRDLTMQADDAGVPIFLKENLVRNPGTQVLKEMPRAR
jgi:protein gp37